MNKIKKGTVRYSDIMDDQPNNRAVQDAMAKCYSVLQTHNNVVASISGGSDSDVMLDLIIRCGGKDKTKFVFFNTGLEYDATKRQIEYLNNQYGISICVIPPCAAYPHA